MTFTNEQEAYHLLANVSYYRFKGYWWEMQSDKVNHKFKPDTNFDTVIEFYTFDRRLRILLFDAIERIEIALRTKLIYHLSKTYGGLWYLKSVIAESSEKQSQLISKLREEFNRSNEIFIDDHKSRLAMFEPDAWKIFEVASLGTLSKIYKNLKHQLPEKAQIAKEMGLNLHSELSSWLESITYVRNIIAHHSRLWNRTMVKRPTNILNPIGLWLQNPLQTVQPKKPFLIISTMMYLCDIISPNHKIKGRLINLMTKDPKFPIYKMGFLPGWQQQDIWK